MLKKLFIGSLVLIVVIAVGASAYNVFVNPQAKLAIESQSLKDTDQISLWSPSDNSAGNIVGDVQAADLNTQESNPVVPIPDANISEIASSMAEENNAFVPGVDNGAAVQGNGSGQGRGRRWAGGGETGTANEGIPQPQNDFQEWVVLQGVVSEYVAPNFLLLTQDGLRVPVQLGNQAYVENLDIHLQDGEAVSVSGYYDPSSEFAVGQITKQAAGQTYALRDNMGRPLWAGGPNR
jgi:hypothetical protein